MAEHLLPPNATEEEKAIASALSRLSDVPVPIRELWNPDSCPADLLPWLAWALSVDVWDTEWSEAKKRQVIKAAIAVHRHKGTPGAVEEAFNALDINGTVEEWFTYGGTPYRFKLVIDIADEGLDSATIEIIKEITQKTKNVRSHLDNLVIKAAPSGGLLLAKGIANAMSLIQTWITPTYYSAGQFSCGGAALFLPFIVTDIQEV